MQILAKHGLVSSSIWEMSTKSLLPKANMRWTQTDALWSSNLPNSSNSSIIEGNKQKIRLLASSLRQVFANYLSLNLQTNSDEN